MLLFEVKRQQYFVVSSDVTLEVITVWYVMQETLIILNQNNLNLKNNQFSQDLHPNSNGRWSPLYRNEVELDL